MVSLSETADIVDEISDVGVEIRGETLAIDVRGGHAVVNVMLERVLWCSEDGSDWTLRNNIDVKTKEQLRAAILGDLDDFAKFIQEVVKVARTRGVPGESND